MLRLLPASIRRALSWIAWRVRGAFGETPFLFFGVVLVVALLFRTGAGWLRDAKEPVAVAPTFVTHAPAVSASAAPAVAPTTTILPTTTSTATVGAAGKVEPLGAPARVTPRPRGHGRRGSAIH